MRRREDRESNKGEIIGDVFTDTKPMWHNNTQYTVQNITISTPECVKRGDKERMLRTTFRVRRERATWESRSPNTAQKPYPGPSNNDSSVPLESCTNVSLNLKRGTVRGTCCETEDRSILGQVEGLQHTGHKIGVFTGWLLRDKGWNPPHNLKNLTLLSAIV